MPYAEHFKTRETIQSEQTDPRQVPNSAGGFTFVIDKWGRLDRWLVLGAEGGTYYASEHKLTIENAKAIIECLDEDGARTVARIVEISDAGRAPKNDAAVFALAIAAGHKDPATRAAALAALPKVCRIGTHLFQFAEAVQGFRGWGRALRRAIAQWYDAKDAAQLMNQLTKYQQRNGWSHRDLLRLAHPTPMGEKGTIYRWAVSGPDGLGARTLKRGETNREYPALGELPPYLAAFERLKTETSPSAVVALITEHGFTHEMVPSEMKNVPQVWEALLVRMPPTAMIRNLAKMTAVGVIGPMNAATQFIADKLTDVEVLRRGRVHPISILLAMKQYASGHGDKGKLTWSASQQIVDALDAAFYAAFSALEPTGKRTLLALDISGSMGSAQIAGTSLTAREASAAMAMVTARVEKSWHVVGFTAGLPNEYRYTQFPGRFSGYPQGLSELAISPRQRLPDIVHYVSGLPMGGTDCALPMLYALQRGLAVDVFHVYTDNETWHGAVHPHQALRQYREKTGIPAKLIVAGMTSTSFTIADPSDAGMLDVAGFDSAAPAIMADFARS